MKIIIKRENVGGVAHEIVVQVFQIFRVGLFYLHLPCFPVDVFLLLQVSKKTFETIDIFNRCCISVKHFSIFVDLE
jgi:hypothetical protein